MKKLILTAILMLITAQAQAIQIDKYKLETKAGEPVNLDVSNNEQQPVSVRIMIDKETTKEVPKGIADCNEQAKAYPKYFVLQPGENQNVKFMSRQPGWCRVYIEADKKDPDTMQVSEGAFVNILMRTGIPMVVTEKK